MDKELEQFQADLLQSVKEMKAGKQARVHRVQGSTAVEARSYEDDTKRKKSKKGS